jgi:hypothetical protein
MWISSIALSNFRCFKSLSFDASKDLNILVGENNVGKSSVFIAVSKLIRLIWNGDKGAFQQGDIRYNQLAANPMSVRCGFALDANDRRDVIDLLSPKSFDLKDKRILIKRLGDILNTLEAVFEWSEKSRRSYIMLGPLHVDDNIISYKELEPGATRAVEELVETLVSEQYSGRLGIKIIGANRWHADNIKNNLLSILKPRFNYFAEYRARPARTARSDALNSLEGSQTANVLLNLKNHTEKRQRDRYLGVKYAFSGFFPKLKFEAVETAPGSGVADIHFIGVGDNYPVPMENVGAGISEMLTFLTNLVTLRVHIFVIEEPELHLHPHAKRSLAALIRHSSDKNQVFVITHDPLFVDPDFIFNLHRFYLTDKRTGTAVASMSSGLSDRDIGQMKTASKDVAKRELYFARAALFVEDESHQRFIEGCAKSLNYSIDGEGLSVVEVGGETGYPSYIKLAQQLNLPFLCLKDSPWGSSPDRPPKTYRSLGCEIEQYLEQAGLSSLMEQARSVVGTSKQRVAKYCGEHIEADHIPEFFSKLLDDAMKLCKKTIKKKK